MKVQKTKCVQILGLLNFRWKEKVQTGFNKS